MIDVKNYSPDYSNLICEGGFGDIYKCKENHNYLVKMTKKLNQQYNGECNKKIIRQLSQHDNLMNIVGIDKNKYGGIHLIYLENINGETLSNYLKNNTINNEQITNIMHQLLSGLEFLHKNKITHRDIKLNNIMIDNKHNIKIIDFGLAYYGLPCQNLVGTSGFFAPEMIYSPKNYDSKCDIWSSGCLLYYMVCKYLPFYFLHDRDCYIEQLKDETPIQYCHNKWQNKILLNLCKNMLVYNNKQRFNSQQCLDILITKKKFN